MRCSSTAADSYSSLDCLDSSDSQAFHARNICFVLQLAIIVLTLWLPLHFMYRFAFCLFRLYVSKSIHLRKAFET